MGVKLSDIIEYKQRQPRDFTNKIIGIDAFNTIYQFLTSIRQSDGTPLMDRSGNVVSHLSGLFQRTVNMLEVGIRPVYIFDGKPPEEKRATLSMRKERKIQAQKDYEEAIEEGDLKKARTKASQTARITDDIINQSKELLTLLGVAHVQAPAEGEAQASWMAQKGMVWGVASQDFDALLFGAPNLIRNMTGSKRRRLPGGGSKAIELQYIDLQSELARIGITREQLIDLAILVGTDYNDGVKGIGPKKGLKFILDNGSLAASIDSHPEFEMDADEMSRLHALFLKPEIDTTATISWPQLNREGLVQLLCTKHDFGYDRTNKTLDKLVKLTKQEASVKKQQTLESWF